jgi:hypothetical protein
MVKALLAPYKASNCFPYCNDRPGAHCYIGAQETSTNGKFTWADESAWDFTGPMADQTEGISNPSESKIVIMAGGNYPAGSWGDWGSGLDKFGVVCRSTCGGEGH